MIVYAGEPRASQLCAVSPRPCVRVTSRAQLIAECKRRPHAVAFVDADLLSNTATDRPRVPIVAILDEVQAELLPRTIRAFDSFPWLAHCVSAAMLVSPQAKPHLTMFLDRLFEGPEQQILGEATVGRVAKLARASRREARFERMHRFFAKHGLSDRAISSISDVAEELVMNALYDAPVEAGYFKKAVPRTEDVELSPDRACEISYGIEDGNAFVRLRDPFGAFTRSRLLEVLERCSSNAVALDESRGGAGLGLWRIFTTASTIAITVIPGRLTEVFIGMATHKGRLVKQLRAVDLYFMPRSSLPVEEDSQQHEMLDQSVTLVLPS